MSVAELAPIYVVAGDTLVIKARDGQPIAEVHFLEIKEGVVTVAVTPPTPGKTIQ